VVPKKQAKFEGSDRQARGRLLAVLRTTHAPVSLGDLIASHSPAQQAKRALESLISDGLVTEVTEDSSEEPHFALTGD
jgi:A/G-specific adenine glycosylase